MNSGNLNNSNPKKNKKHKFADEDKEMSNINNPNEKYKKEKTKNNNYEEENRTEIKEKFTHPANDSGELESPRTKTKLKTLKSSKTRFTDQHVNLIEFPNFYEIDLIDEELENAKIETENDFKDEEKDESLSSEGKAVPELENLVNFIEDNNLTTFSNDSFNLESLIYQHRDGIFKGTLLREEKVIDVNVKMCSIASPYSVNILLHELNVLKTLSKNGFKNANLMYGVHIDRKSNFFYSFFEYFPKETNLAAKIVNLNNFQKLIVLKNLLQFTLELHSLGIIHRDLKLEYFSIDSTMTLKMFDFSNALKLENISKEEKRNLNTDEKGKSRKFKVNEKPDTKITINYTNNDKDEIEINPKTNQNINQSHSNNESEEDPSNTINRNITLNQNNETSEINISLESDNNEINLNSNQQNIDTQIQQNIIEITPSINKPKEINSENIPKNKTSLPEYKYFSKKIPFITSKYCAPEVTLCRPLEGYAQDIWSLGCNLIELFIDYSKYDLGTTDILLNKIFRSEQSIITRIPKDLDQSLAVILVKCFDPQPASRIDILGLIEKFNKFFKKNNYKALEVDSSILNRYQVIKEVYLNYYKSHTFSEIIAFEFCRYHRNKPKSFFCENCDDFFCENCIVQTHGQHCYAHVDIDLECKLTVLKMLSEEVEERYCDTNFLLIDEFRRVFEKDYSDEQCRIKRQFDEIRRKVDNLESLQLRNLLKSRDKFLDNKFRKTFAESNVVADYYRQFYNSKDGFYSHYNRFKSTLENAEVTMENLRDFNKKFNKFNEFAEVLKTHSDKLIAKSSSLKIPGKYIFRHENYTEEFIKYLKTIENKIFQEKHKFFDYSGNDSLFLTQELLMIIPLTNCVFSYIKNSYKKIQVNFEMHKIKMRSFLPGCATLHIGNTFYITGGEIKDEAVPEFIFMNVGDKIVEEGGEMNFSHRYHSMVSLNGKYIVVLGGWNSNEVEIIDAENLDNWRILPNMQRMRSDATVYFFNRTFLYVVGGWDYSNKSCVMDVERYEIVNSEWNVNFNKQWEDVKIKSNPVYLKKYNMGLIPLREEKNEHSEKILLVGGFDEEYDYSPSVIKVELDLREPSIFVNKDIKGLPTDGESSFWYEKNFHLMYNDFENEPIAVNFNCFNNIYVYSLRKSEFKLYTNSTQS